jgi:hypothetical protein
MTLKIWITTPSMLNKITGQCKIHENQAQISNLKTVISEDNKSHVVLQQPETICMITMAASKKTLERHFQNI